MLMSSWGVTASRIRLALLGISISIALAVTACGSSAVGAAPIEPDGPLVQQMTSEVSDARAMKHLQALQKIADEHGGNRASGTSGYDASVDYVVGVLRRAGFKVTTPTYQGDGRRSGAPERNVIAQTSTGDPGNVVMIGAHLDSVEDGPGIVDDGSGVASLLEIATQLSANPSVQNTVRFAFFGGEENGGEGSDGYVRGLSNEDRKKIKLYLNVDMVASKNGGYFVQGGKGQRQRRVRTAGFSHHRTGARRPVGQDRRDQAGDHRVRRRRRISLHRRGYPGRRRREWRRRPEDDGAGQGMGRAGPRTL